MLSSAVAFGRMWRFANVTISMISEKAKFVWVVFLLLFIFIFLFFIKNLEIASICIGIFSFPVWGPSVCLCVIVLLEILLDLLLSPHIRPGGSNFSLVGSLWKIFVQKPERSSGCAASTRGLCPRPARGVRGHAPPENFGFLDAPECNFRLFSQI